jgi:hypothetical protein
LQRGSPVEVKIKGEQDSPFHGFELVDSIRGICHFDIVLHAWRVDFFIFAGNPETGHSHELIFLFGDLMFGCVGIEVGQCKEEGLFLELK